ncbi:MAG TPA: hypothetical protein VGD56_19920 [Gemmatirosa sp.]
MGDRRYSDDEVRRILALAAEAETAAAATPERPWTLDEVTQIGAEAGMAPHAITAAALALERRPAGLEPGPGGGRYFGLPVAVSRAVPLARTLSDEDWMQLVAQLRETFAAEGRTHVSGGHREWRVGNLRVTHEPAGSGAVLAFRTRKGNARATFQLGVLLVLTAIASGVIGIVGAHAGAAAGVGSDPREAPRVALAVFLGLAGVLLLLGGALRLPAWARVRARQFEALATYARGIAAG